MAEQTEARRTQPEETQTTQSKATKVQAIKGHLQSTQNLELPRWLMYVIGVLAALAVIYAGIQQVRIWRWSGILKAAKIRINELDSRVQTSRLEGMREVASQQHGVNQEQVKKIDKQIVELDKKKEELQKQVGRMQPKDLLQAFKEEGF